jgi:hypothetical protein
MQKYKNVVYFEQKLIFRIKDKDLQEAYKCYMLNQDKYFNLSHYIRCAIIQLNRREMEEHKRVKNEKLVKQRSPGKNR